MKALFCILVGLGLTGCSSTSLMRCPDLAPEGVYHCTSHVDGAYYQCRKSSEIRACHAPN